MRVAHVITRLILGGAQENTVATVLGLRLKAGVSVQLLSGPTHGSEGSIEPAVASVPGLLTLVPDLIRPIRPWSDLAALRALTAAFRAWRPDIVHTHSGKAGVLGRVAAARARVPLIIHSIHGPSFGPFQGAIANTLLRAAEVWAARHTHHFITVAQAMTEQYLAAGIGRPDQYSRVFSGFNLDRFLEAKPDPALRAQLRIPANAFVVAKLARLAPLKGHEDLLQAAPAIVRQVPSVRFLLIGDGPLRSDLEHRTAELGLRDHFVFAGLIPAEQVPAYLALADALAHLSYREGLPRALPQALATGAPVVAYDCDGAREVCLHERTGLLLRLGDTAALAAAIGTLAQTPDLRRRLGAEGRRFVAERFPEQRMVDEIHRLYVELIQRHRVRPGAGAGT